MSDNKRTFNYPAPAPVVAPVPERRRWEYKRLWLGDAADFASKVNELGLLGWELVSFHRQAGHAEFYFKRPLPPEDLP